MNGWKNEFSSLKLSLVILFTLLFLFYFFLSTQYCVLGQRKSLRKTSIVDDMLSTSQNTGGFLPEMWALIRENTGQTQSEGRGTKQMTYTLKMCTYFRLGTFSREKETKKSQKLITMCDLKLDSEPEKK